MTTAIGVRRYEMGKLIEGAPPSPEEELEAVRRKPAPSRKRVLAPVAKMAQAAREPLPAAVAALEQPVAPEPTAVASVGPAALTEQAVITTTAQMRGFLLKQMVLAAEGKIDSERVRNVCALSQQVYHATKLEIDAARVMKETKVPIQPLALSDGIVE